MCLLKMIRWHLLHEARLYRRAGLYEMAFYPAETIGRVRGEVLYRWSILFREIARALCVKA